MFSRFLYIILVSMVKIEKSINRLKQVAVLQVYIDRLLKEMA